MSGRGAVSLGVAGALGPDAVASLAQAAERAGFATLWVNDTPGADALAALAAAARVTERIGLATGVVPVDRRGPDEIAAAVASSGLPRERLTLGIGSGAARAGSLARVRDAVSRLHDAGVARVVVGALGPRMRRAGAEHAEGVLLTWVPADEAGRQARELHALAPRTHVAVYVRTAIAPGARPRLDEETARYASFPNYAANFARLGVEPRATTIADPAALRDALPAYTAAVDEVVLRAITADDTVDAYLAFVRRTAPRPL